MINKRKPSVLTFEFFEDETGRLRAKCEELGLRRPVESATGKRYSFPKVFGMQRWFVAEDIVRLQSAQAGDRVEIRVR